MLHRKEDVEGFGGVHLEGGEGLTDPVEVGRYLLVARKSLRRGRARTFLAIRHRVSSAAPIVGHFLVNGQMSAGGRPGAHSLLLFQLLRPVSRYTPSSSYRYSTLLFLQYWRVLMSSSYLQVLPNATTFWISRRTIAIAKIR
jgi:hypothetical protein